MTLRRLLLVLVGAAVASVAAAAPAAAHNVLIATAPLNGQTVTQTPGAVVLTFDQPAIAMGTQLVVTGPGGPVQQGPAQLVDNTVRQELQPGAPAGPYTVAWRVTSADGHLISGTFTFRTQRAAPGVPPASVPPALPAPARSGLPWWTLLPIGVAVLLGATLLVRRFRRPRPDPTGGLP